MSPSARRPTRRPCTGSSSYGEKNAIGPTPDTAWTLYVGSALAGVLLVVAVLASLPLGSLP